MKRSVNPFNQLSDDEKQQDQNEKWKIFIIFCHIKPMILILGQIISSTRHQLTVGLLKANQ